MLVAKRLGYCTTTSGVYLCVLSLLSCLTSSYAVQCCSLPTIWVLWSFFAVPPENTRYVHECTQEEQCKTCCCVLVLVLYTTTMRNRSLLLVGYCPLRAVARATLYHATLRYIKQRLDNTDYNGSDRYRLKILLTLSCIVTPCIPCFFMGFVHRTHQRGQMASKMWQLHTETTTHCAWSGGKCDYGPP